MATLTILEKYFAGDYRISPCATEQDYYALWFERKIDALAPCDMAIAGGLLADRLPWAFTAGYQATLRNSFPTLPASGWAAFVATEDTKEPELQPGTTLKESGRGYDLCGHKGWVAHSDLVEHLIVTVNDPGGDKRRAIALTVERASSGVVLTHRSKPGFLAGMSQGFAHFENVAIDQTQIVDFEPIRQFGRCEAKFVMLAASAFMLARLDEGSELQDRLIATATALRTLISEAETSRQVYASIDREFQHCVDHFERHVETSLIADYAADRRLFRMYTDRIQRRREYAKRELKN